MSCPLPFCSLYVHFSVRFQPPLFLSPNIIHIPPSYPSNRFLKKIDSPTTGFNSILCVHTPNPTATATPNPYPIPARSHPKHSRTNQLEMDTRPRSKDDKEVCCMPRDSNHHRALCKVPIRPLRYGDHIMHVLFGKRVHEQHHTTQLHKNHK